MGNYTQNFKERNSGKGRNAEDECEKYFKRNNILYTEYGFRCLDIIGKEFYMLPNHLKATPDFVVFRNKTSFVEAKGFKNQVKLKLHDMKHYEWWAKQMPLFIYIYLFDKKSYKIVKYENIKRITETCETGMYNNNKEYYIVPWKKIK